MRPFFFLYFIFGWTAHMRYSNTHGCAYSSVRDAMLVCVCMCLPCLDQLASVPSVCLLIRIHGVSRVLIYKQQWNRLLWIRSNHGLGGYALHYNTFYELELNGNGKLAEICLGGSMTYVGLLCRFVNIFYAMALKIIKSSLESRCIFHTRTPK